MNSLWQLWAGALNKERCEAIVNQCSLIEAKDGSIFSGGNDDNKVRNSQVRWVNDRVINDLMMHYVKTANRNAFGVDIDGLWDIQFTEYDGAKEGFYSWHHDVDWNRSGPYNRKLTIVIQLDDPSDYTGGEFEFSEVETPTAFKEQGSVLVFPSYLSHRVLPVTEGVRHSLVGWVEGPRWR